MTSRLSAVALRTLLVDTSAELASINSTQLPDGATVFDNQSDTLWRLDKTAGTVFDPLLGTGLVLKPDDQTAARWFADAIGGSSPYYHSSYLAAPVAVIMTSNQWNALGSTSGTFAESSGSDAAFILSATSGIVHYAGPPRTFLVTMQASVNNGSSSTPIDVHAVIGRNGDVVAGGTTDYSSKGEQQQEVINTVSLITVQRVMQLSDGIDIQMFFRNSTNGDDLVANNYQCTIAPL